MQLYLIRHPQPSVAPSVCYGQKDLLLSEKAQQQLETLATSLQHSLPPGIPVYSSPLQRCILLAEKLHPQPLQDKRLIEMHFGNWEMRLWDRLPREQLDAWAADPLHYVIPGGESVAQMQQRVLQFVAEKRSSQTQQLALVTHGGVMKILMGEAQHLPVEEWMALHFDYGALHIIDFNW